jgi:hypothetical protein
MTDSGPLWLSDAVGTTESGPLWLRAVVASIPLLVAFVAGAFGLINTVNRRTERLKNLVEASKGLPEILDKEVLWDDYAMERLMLREINAIEKSTSPGYLLQRRVTMTLIIMFYCLVALYFLDLPLFHSRLITQTEFQWTAIGLSVAVTVIYYPLRSRYLQMELKLKRRSNTLERLVRSKGVAWLAAHPQGRDTESVSPDAHRSQAGTEAGKAEPSDSSG